MKHAFTGCIIVVVAIAGGGACRADDPADPGTAYTLEKVSGDSQAVTPLATSAPLVVRVVDADGGPIAGVVVQFLADSGAGSMTTEADTSDADGRAASAFHAGSRAGRRRLTARVSAAEIGFDLAVIPGSAVGGNFSVYGWNQGGPAGTILPAPLGVGVRDQWGNGISGHKVAWRIRTGGGAVSSDTTITDAAGIAEVVRTLGPVGGGQLTDAVIVALDDTVVFHSSARGTMTMLGGGNNVTGRCSGRIWAHGDHAYSATWTLGMPCPHAGGGSAARFYVWDLRAGDPQLADSVEIPDGEISDVEVSADGTLLLATAEDPAGGTGGLYLYSLADPARPALLDAETDADPGEVAGPLRAATFADLGGRRYIFASRGPTLAPSALLVYRIEPQAVDKIVPVGEKLQDEHSIVDQVAGPGLVFASVGATGLRIYDVGAGPAGGSPELPFRLWTISPPSGGVSGAIALFHHPIRAKRYLFEAVQVAPPDGVGWIRVHDVTDPDDPFLVTTIRADRPAVRSLWVDDQRGILYAAYVDGEVVAFDVLGSLTAGSAGELTGREIARIGTNGGAGDVWGISFARGALWVSDKQSGIWRIAPP